MKRTAITVVIQWIDKELSLMGTDEDEALIAEVMNIRQYILASLNPEDYGDE